MNKAKILLAFYMIATRVDNVYSITLPQRERNLLRRLSFISFKGFGTTPMECLGYSGYKARLILWMLLPPIAMLVVLFGVVVTSAAEGRRKAKANATSVRTTGGGGIIMDDATREGTKRRKAAHGGQQIVEMSTRETRQLEMEAVRSKSIFEKSLPIMLRVMFFLYPVVTNVAFEGFPCHEIDDGHGGTVSYLVADVSVTCYTPEHTHLRVLSIIAICLYPIGTWVLNLVLLWRASPAILAGKETALTSSIAFLYREYDVACFWWELIEMLKRFLLVGVFVVIAPGTAMQVSVGAIVSAVFLLFQMQAKPYRKMTDDYLASASSFALTMLFLCSIMYKYAALTASPDVRSMLSPQQERIYLVDSLLLSAILLASVVGSVLFAGVLVVVQIIMEARNRRHLRLLKYAKSDKEVQCRKLDDPQAYHLFLSHAWPAAQDRMRIVKARFRESLPSCRVFLDVDNLKSGSGTAEVDKSECILVFCTKQYFEKKNSMKELYRAVVNRRPILAMLEPDESQDGGLDEAAIRAMLTDARLDRFKLRKKWQEWMDEGEVALQGHRQRAPDGADVTAALFATSPVEWSRLPHFQDVTLRLIAQNGVLHGEGGELYMQNEAAKMRVSLPAPYGGRRFHLFCSEHNAGAAEVARELQESGIIAKGELTMTSDVRDLDECDHMLLLLDDRTWRSGARTARLVEHIHAAMGIGVHILCVHEFPSLVGGPRHACDFGLMFRDDWTPSHLTGGETNLYREIALALTSDAWRKPGLVAFASNLAKGGEERMPVEVPVSDEDGLPTKMDDPTKEGATPVEVADDDVALAV